MNSNVLLKPLLAAAVLASALLAASAQPAPKPAAPRSGSPIPDPPGYDQPASQPAVPRNSPYLLEIENGFLLLPTGKKTEATLENVAEQLRKLELNRNGQPANIVLSPDLPRIKIANLKLAATTLNQELEALRVASGERFVWNYGGGPLIDPVSGLDSTTGLPAQAPNQTPLFILHAAPEAARGKLRVEAFSLGGYFDSRRKSDDAKAYQLMVDEEIEQLEKIVAETADVYAAMNRELNAADASVKGAPSLRFHRGANLLIVMGEPEAVELAAKVVAALPGVKRSGSSGGGGGAVGTDPFAGRSEYGRGNEPHYEPRYGTPSSSGNPGGPPVRR